MGRQKFFMGLAKFVIMGSLSMCLSGCLSGPPPIEDYAFARAAIEAAKTVESAKYSPGFFHKAEAAYHRGESLYKDREFDDARDEFRLAREAAEKAENSARLTRFKNGDVL